MVNPLLILPLLNSTLSTTTTNCFLQPDLSSRPLPPLSYRQCRSTLAEVLPPAGDTPTTPLTFGRSSDVGFEVPESWSHASCELTIDMVRPDVTETATFAAIVQKAREVTSKCVSNPPYLGGETLVGDVGFIKISVHGEGINVVTER